MNWLTLLLMNYQLKKATTQRDSEENIIVQKAKHYMAESYKTTIMYIEANNKYSPVKQFFKNLKTNKNDQ